MFDLLCFFVSLVCCDEFVGVLVECCGFVGEVVFDDGLFDGGVVGGCEIVVDV